MTICEVIQALEATRPAHLLAMGASDQELTTWEQTNGLIIPEEFKEFLRFSNGAVLYETEEILGIQRPWAEADTIQDVLVRLRADREASLPRNLLPFFSGLNGRYACFVVGEPSLAGIVEWVAGRGQIGRTFGSFGDWFQVVLYSEYHSRYAG